MKTLGNPAMMPIGYLLFNDNQWHVLDKLTAHSAALPGVLSAHASCCVCCSMKRLQSLLHGPGGSE
jgi:hypothetical protein